MILKKWDKEKIGAMVGDYRSAFLSYANDEKVRNNAASGGTVSSILLFCINKKLIDGALVCKTDIVNGKVRTKFVIGENRKTILEAQGSKYVNTRFIKEAFPLIEEYDGRLAIVGLPCEIAFIRKMLNKNRNINRKIVLLVSLFCGHTSQPGLIDNMIERLTKGSASELTSFRFRYGHWRGKLRAEFQNGAVIEKPFSYFGQYQNLYFYSERKCLYCFDHFGYKSDICAGDLWTRKMKKEKMKYSALITKTGHGNEIVLGAAKNGYLNITGIKIEEILEGQSRTAPFHFNLSARHKAGKLIHLNIPDKVKKSVSWHEFIVALIVLFNWKWSQHRRYQKIIFKVPNTMLTLYLYLFKILESL